MKKENQQKEKAVNTLEKFQLSKKEGLLLEGGPELSRGTVSSEVNP